MLSAFRIWSFFSRIKLKNVYVTDVGLKNHVGRMKTIQMRNLRLRLILLLLLPAGLLLFYFVPKNSVFIETYYSNCIYKVFSRILSLITGIFPFSLAELGLVILVILTPILLIRVIRKIAGAEGHRLKLLGWAALNFSAAVAVVYFSLVALWTMNYNRLPFAEIAGLKIEKSSVDDLAKVCRYLISQANTQRTKVTEDKNGVMTVKKGYRDVFKRSGEGYAKASALYPQLSGRYGSPKPVLLSKVMSYTGIEGIFCPFTSEANINVDIPKWSIPSTTCHEMAHQRGFAREDEANYISYIACTLHPDPDFQYSGALLALIYSMNALYDHDRGAYAKAAADYSRGIIRDLNANNLYWQRHEGTVERISNRVNNAYLKANKQKEGVYSYGRMVDLLIAQYKQK